MTEPTKAVFLSYASQDGEAAARICEALRAAGFEVWFDQSELRGGDAWDQQIRRQIRECALFVAIISAHTDARPEGYFRLEWKLAVDRSHLLADDEPFLLPVVVDATLDGTARVPDKFRGVQWTRLPDGATPPAFVERVSRLLARDPRGSPLPARALPSATAPSRSRSTLLLLVIAAAAIAVGYLAVDRLVLSKHVAAPRAVSTATVPSAQETIPEKSIAVLPFVDMSEKKDQEYFSDGLSEELIDHLSHSSDLKVIARTSSFQFKGKNEDVRSIASKLGVANLLEGSVRKAGQQMRITAQLIRASDGTHLWSQTYDRHVKDIFKVQDEIAGTVAEALNTALDRGTAVTKAGTQNVEAYNLLLKGNFFYERFTKGDLDRAIEQYQQALKVDPDYSLAWAKLAMAYIWRGYGNPQTSAQTESKARDALQRALALDPNSQTAHRWLARVYHNYDLNWVAAQNEYERAIALDPGSKEGRLARGDFAIMAAQRTGRCEPVIQGQLERVVRNPLDTSALSALGYFQQCAGQLEASAASYRRLLELNPAYNGAQSGYAGTLLLMGKPADALAAADKETDEELRLAILASIYWSLGRRTDADSALNQLESKFADSFPEDIAGVHAYRGEPDAAMEWLERTYRLRNIGLQFIRLDPLLVSLHGDPRYEAFLRKLKLFE